jgi:hydroxypyruvate reductase
MSIDILVLGVPALAEQLLQQRAAEHGWTLHRPGSDDPPPAEIAGRIVAVAASGGWTLDARLIDTLPALKIVAVHAVGYDLVDVAHARARGVVVAHTPQVMDDDVADVALGLVLSVLRGLTAADAYVRAGRWPGEGSLPLRRSASGLRYGVLGLGRIGTAIARRLSPLAGSIAYHTRRPVEDAPWRHEPDLLALARDVDVLVVAVPGGDATRGLVSAEVIEALGPQGVLINIARGEVVDQPALITALQEGRLGGAGLDVFDGEPEVPQALIDSDRTVLTPHMASATVEARTAMAELMIANLEAVLEGGAAPTPVPFDQR